MNRPSPFVFALTMLALVGCANTMNMPDLPGLPGGGGATDEEQIAAILEDVADGMENRRIYKVLAHVSRTYRDAEGRDYEALQEYLKGLFRQYREIRIDRVWPRIAVNGEKARVVETFSTFAEPVPGTNGRPFNIQGQVTVYLEKTSGRWLIVEWGNLM